MSVDGRDAIDGRPADLRRQARLPGPRLGLRRHRGLAHLAFAGGGVSFLVGARLVRRAHRQRARRRRDWRRRVPRAPPPAARLPRAAAAPVPVSASVPVRLRRRLAAAPTRASARRARSRKEPAQLAVGRGAAPPALRRPRDAAGEAVRAHTARAREREAQPFARTAAAPAWAPNTARRSTRASTRSSSCAPTRAVPAAVLGVRYNDRDGLLAMGIPVDSVLRPGLLATTTTTATCAARPSRSRSPTGASPRPRPDGSALADGDKPGEDRRWVCKDEADEVLLQAYRAGDVRAFERLVARHEKPIWNFLRRFVARRGDRGGSACRRCSCAS